MSSYNEYRNTAGALLVLYLCANTYYTLIQVAYVLFASIASNSDHIPVFPEIFFQGLILAQPFVIAIDILLYRIFILPHCLKVERHTAALLLCKFYLLALSYPWDLMMCYYPGNGMNTVAIGLLADVVLFVGLQPTLGLPEIGWMPTLIPMNGPLITSRQELPR